MGALLARVVSRWAQVDPVLAHVLSRLGSVVGALLALLLVYRVLVHLVDRLVAEREGETPISPRVQRARTLGPLLKNAIRWVFLFVGFIIVLREVGVDVQALLVSAGVLGLAFSLGAQTLIRDFIAGFFLLFEGLIAVGDEIDVGQYSGVVEAVGLRVTKVRMLDGALRVFPNGQLTEFANRNRDWARAVVEVAVPYDADVKKAIDVLQRVGGAWAAETEVALEAPQAQGIIRFGASDVVLRLMAKVDPARRFATELELRRRIKEAFDRERIPLPSIPRTLLVRQDGAKEHPA